MTTIYATETSTITFYSYLQKELGISVKVLVDQQIITQVSECIDLSNSVEEIINSEYH